MVMWQGPCGTQKQAGELISGPSLATKTQLLAGELISGPSLATKTQLLAGELISGPSLATKTQLLSFNGTHSRVVTGHLTGHNTL
jgi:hypothetical protein